MNYDQFYSDFLVSYPYPRKLKDIHFKDNFSSFHLKMNGKRVINFSSSDYLGLSQHPILIQKSQEYLSLFGTGSSSSRLVTGNFSFYKDLESKLAKAVGKSAALILGTGYQTNQSVLEALLSFKIFKQAPVVFCDRLCHVSMLSIVQYARFHRFLHNDLDHLTFLLKKYSDKEIPKFILIESVYSMEGDKSDLPKLIEISKENNAFLYVDEAHALGVFGKDGWGETPDFSKNIDLVMGTFSKALGCYGGFVACSSILKDYLVNQCKGLIYSTGLPPSVLGTISAVIDLLPTLTKERERLLKISRETREFFIDNEMDIGTTTSHIVPWIIGDAKKTWEISERLESNGILGTPIQPPSVPIGKSRIRFCLSAAHSDDDIQKLWSAVKRVRREFKI